MIMEEKILIEIANNYGITPDVIESLKGLIIDFIDVIEQVCNNLNQVFDSIEEKIRAFSNNEIDEETRSKTRELKEFVKMILITDNITKKSKKPP